MATTEVKEKIKEIKSVIGDRGWTTGAIENQNGEVCLVGAWAYTEGWDGTDNYEAYDIVDNSKLGQEVAKAIANCGINYLPEVEGKTTTEILEEIIENKSDPQHLTALNDILESEDELFEILDCAITKAED